MATYVKGDAVANAASYELLEKISAAGNLIDIANPTSANAVWSYNETTREWTATNSNSANLRWDAELEAGVTVVFSADYVVNSGSFILTIRNSTGTILVSTTVLNTGTYSAKYTTTEAGTYQFRTAGNQAENSAVCSNVRAEIQSDDGETAEDTYVSLATGSEINFDVSALGLAAGDHTLVVKAKADGYEDSDYSNEVVYTAT